MPRSTIGDRRTAAFDKSLELRDYALAAISADTAGTPIAFQGSKSDVFRMMTNYPTYTGYVAGTAQWVVDVQASTTLAGTYVTVASATLVGTAQEAEVAVSGNQVSQLVPGAKFIRCNARKIGAAGNLQFGAYIANADAC
jgi:hypothetical protein